MDVRILELAVDLTKSAMLPTTNSWVFNGPEKVNIFLEEVTKKLQQLKNQT